MRTLQRLEPLTLFIIICHLLLSITFSRAQNGEYPLEFGVPATTRSSTIVPLPSSKSLTLAQLRGKKFFVQRCSVCHLPALPSYTTYGPVRDGKLASARGEAALREQIMEGSPRMPGWQYTLSPTEVD